MALEELGVTFIKLGQVLSTRPDLLSSAYIAELAKLRDSVPPVASDAIVKRVEEELGGPIGKWFSRFNPEALASASIGQVHDAVLLTGEAVVVKVQKPGVERQVEADLGILTELAAQSARSTYGAMYDLPALVDEFAWTLREELDYVREGRNADLFRRNFAEQPWVRVPRVFWELTTSRVLTMERIDGIPIGQALAVGTILDRKALATTTVEWILKQVFEDGFFHADPHPGNFLLMEGDVLGVVDFGMVGRIDEDARYNLLRLVLALTQKDSWSIMDFMAQLGIRGLAVNRAALGREIQRIVERYYGLELREIRLTTLIEDVMGMVRRHHLDMPAYLAVLLKTLTMHEGLAERIDPHFRLAEILERYAQNTLTKIKTAEIWGKRLARGTVDAAALGTELPSALRRILVLLERGDLEVSLKHDELTHALKSFNSMLRRLTVAVLAGASVVAWATLRRRENPGKNYSKETREQRGRKKT